MDQPYILIFYTGRDPCGRSVAEYVEQVSPIAVLAVDIEASASFAVEFDAAGKFCLTYDGKIFGTPSACWSRNKMRSPPRTLTEEDVHQQIRASEWRGLVNGVTQVFQDRKVNGQHASSNKVYQYQAATAAGFKVPAGSFFLGKAHGADFLDRHPQSVFKAIGYPNIADPNLKNTGTILVTTGVDVGVFEAADERRFDQSPTWFQERLLTGVEYRVIAVGDFILSHRMSGRIEDRRFVDGRMLSPPFERCDLPPSVRENIARYLNVTGLDYGVFDLIECSDGFYYLECNPEGQWHSARHTGDFDQVVRHVADLIFERAAAFGAPTRGASMQGLLSQA